MQAFYKAWFVDFEPFGGIKNVTDQFADELRNKLIKNSSKLL